MVTILFTKGGRVPTYEKPQDTGPLRVPVDVAITLVSDGRATYPDGEIKRLREIENGDFRTDHLSFGESIFWQIS